MSNLRDLLTPLLPAGLTPDDFPNLREASEDGFQGGRGSVSTDETAARLESRGVDRTQDDYDDLIRAQVAAKESYVARITALLDRAEKSGPSSRDAIREQFKTIARRELESSFVRGVDATAEGDARDPRFRKWLGARVDFEASRFDEFLGRVYEDSEAMPRDRRADLYARTLDHAFNRGAFAVYGGDVRVHWMLSPAEHCCLLDPSLRVLTDRGPVPIAEIQVGDMVATHRGRFRRVLRTLRHAPKTQRSATFRSPVTGRMVTCTDDHPWRSAKKWKRTYELVSGREIERSPLWQVPRDGRSEESVGRLHQLHLSISRLDAMSRLFRDEGRTNPALSRLRLSGEAGSDVFRLARGAFLSVRSEDATGAGSLYGDVPQAERTTIGGVSGALALGTGARSDSGRRRTSPRQRCEDGRSVGKSATAHGSGTQAFASVVTFDLAPLPPDAILYDLAVEEDRSFVVEGLISHNSDCLERAARGPYVPPGRGDGDPDGPPELPSFPRDGSTECLGNCKCYLVVERPGEDEEDPVYEAGDRVVDPGIRIEDGDETTVDEIDPEELVDIQAEADGYVEAAQYARAMHDLQVDGGETDWIEARTDANKALIDLQDRTGLRFVPRTGADAVSLVARELPPQGYEPVGPANRSLVVEGMDAAAADGTDFTFGVVTKYDRPTGRGIYVDQTGEAIPFDLTATSNRLVLGVRRGKRKASPRDWESAQPFRTGAVIVGPEGFSFAVEAPDDEGSAATVSAFRSIFDRSLPPALHGVQVRVTDGVEAPVVRGATILAPPGLDQADASIALAGVAVPALFATGAPPKVVESTIPKGFRSPLSKLAVVPAQRPQLDDFLYWYSRWLLDPDAVPELVLDYYEGFEDEDFDDPEYPALDPDGRFEENDADYYTGD